MRTCNDSQKRDYQYNVFLLSGYEIRPFAEKYFSYEYYKMMSWFEKDYIRQKYKDRPAYCEVETCECPWIEYQLDWIGKKYSADNWITAEKHNAVTPKIYTSLKKYCETQKVITDQQLFKMMMIQYAGTFQPPHKLASTKGSVSMINQALMDWNFPFRIKSIKKSIKGNQLNYWFVIPAESNTNNPE